jgi:hypothetical protein
MSKKSTAAKISLTLDDASKVLLEKYPNDPLLRAVLQNKGAHVGFAKNDNLTNAPKYPRPRNERKVDRSAQVELNAIEYLERKRLRPKI